MGTIILSGVWYIVKNYGIYLLIFFAGVYAWHRVTKWWHGDSDSGVTINGTIVNIKSSNQYTIQAGLFKKRTRLVTLYGIAVAVEEPARNLIDTYIKSGDVIGIEIESGGRHVNDIIGVVLAPNGTNLNLTLLENGLAKVTCTDKEFVAAEKKAKASGVGIWKKTLPEPKKPRWWTEELSKDSIYSQSL